jgi:hypothetical protein
MKGMGLRGSKNKVKAMKHDDHFEEAGHMLEKMGNVIKLGVKKDRRKKVKERGVVEQNNDYTKSNNKGSTFWMSLSDFSKYFYILTVCFANDDYQ